VNLARFATPDGGKEVASYWRGNEMSVENPIVYANFALAPAKPVKAQAAPEAPTAAAPQPAGDEQKASALLETARQMRADKLPAETVGGMLKQLVEKYPETKAAADAKKMLEELK